MAYTTIASTDTDVDSPITVALMTALAENPTAIANGDTGAPKIQEAAMNAASVNQAALKTSAGEVSTGSSYIVSILPGGEYGFYPRLKGNDDTSANTFLASMSSPINTSAAIKTYLQSLTYRSMITIGEAGSQIVYAQQRYISASPPNWINKADGEIPLFVFAQIKKATSEIVSVYCADAAPWHYNGPTDIRPQKIVKNEDGTFTKYRERKDMGDYKTTLAQAKLDPAKLQEYYSVFNSAPIVYEEITQDVKNKDMSLIPRPFEPDVDHEVILLNPVGDLIWNLNEMTNHEQFDINELLHDGYFKVQNTAMNISTPPGVQAFDFRWK